MTNIKSLEIYNFEDNWNEFLPFLETEKTKLALKKFAFLWNLQGNMRKFEIEPEVISRLQDINYEFWNDFPLLKMSKIEKEGDDWLKNRFNYRLPLAQTKNDYSWWVAYACCHEINSTLTLTLCQQRWPDDQFFIADSSVHSIIIKERSNIGYDLSGYFESQENLDYYRNYAGPGFLKTTENLVAYLVYRETKTQYESLFNCKLPVV